MIRFRSVWLAIVGLGAAMVVLLSPGMGFSFGDLSSLRLENPNAFAALTAASPGERTSYPETVQNPARYGSGLQRTLYLLASSTPTHRHTVRILFYGQSLTKQEWWIDVVSRLRQRFPYANLIVENRAIGGFASPLLVQTAEHDLYPFYPDLMIFHNYGDEKNYEAIIANTRRRTTSEVALMSDHVAWLPGEPEANPAAALRTYRWHNQHVQWLGAIAEKYGCELIDIRTPWEKYLKTSNLPTTDLLIENDGHLNPKGNQLMTQLVLNHLLQSPIPATAPATQTVQDLPISSAQWQNGKFKQVFEGNRIDLITRTPSAQNRSYAAVLIDGKPPSQFPDLYHVTRPSDSFAVDMPGLLQVQSKAPLILEDWSLIITDANPEMNQFQFDLYGSRTGFDGSGTSTEPFVSRSGRVAIEPQFWWLDDAFAFTQKPVPLGFQIRWRVEPLFTDVYVSPVVQDASKEVSITLAQNLRNSRHTLELIAADGKPVAIDALRVYRPGY